MCAPPNTPSPCPAQHSPLETQPANVPPRVVHLPAARWPSAHLSRWGASAVHQAAATTAHTSSSTDSSVAKAHPWQLVQTPSYATTLHMANAHHPAMATTTQLAAAWCCACFVPSVPKARGNPNSNLGAHQASMSWSPNTETKNLKPHVQQIDSEHCPPAPTCDKSLTLSSIWCSCRAPSSARGCSSG